MADLISLDDDVQRYKTRPVKDWKVDDVCDFLASLELKTLLPSVKENAVDGAMLLELSDGELEEDLGFKALQIKKMKRSLEAHNAAPAAAAAAAVTAPVTPPPAMAAPQPDREAEAAAVAGAAEAARAEEAAQEAEAARAAEAAKAKAEAAHGAQTTAARFAAARDLLGSAHHDLHNAEEQLHHAMTSQAVNTGLDRDLVGRRVGGLGHNIDRNPIMSMATAGKAHKHCEAAKQLSDKASKAIEQARKHCPELPPIRTPDVKVVGGIVMQEIFDSTVADAVRLGKIKAAEGEVKRCAAEVKAAYERCGATAGANAAYAQQVHQSAAPDAAAPQSAQYPPIGYGQQPAPQYAPQHAPQYAAPPPQYPPAGYAPQYAAPSAQAYADPYANQQLDDDDDHERRRGGMVGGLLVGAAIARPGGIGGVGGIGRVGGPFRRF